MNITIHKLRESRVPRAASIFWFGMRAGFVCIDMCVVIVQSVVVVYVLFIISIFLRLVAY